MRWETVEDYDAMSRRAAAIFLDAVRNTPSVALGLPTGGTPLGMYRRIVAECSTTHHCFRDATTFNLDEYVGLAPSDPRSYCAYMRENLFAHVDLDPSRMHIPDGLATRIRERNPGIPLEHALDLECAAYEESIARAGGLDLTFLGLGRNGHIAFNEPGSPFESRTRVVTLTRETRDANACYFPEGEVPSHAITMGVGTILSSRSIVLLASGSSKREAVERLRSAEVTEEFPASALHLHSDTIVICDEQSVA